MRNVIQLLALLLLAVCLGCGGGSGRPVTGFFAVNIEAPPALRAGEPADWTVRITGGQGPYQVSFDLGGGLAGASQVLTSTVNADATRTEAVFNLTPRAGDWNASVQVADANGITASDSHAYSVGLASAVRATAVFTAGKIMVATDIPADGELTITASTVDDLRLGAPSYSLVGGTPGATLTVTPLYPLDGARGSVTLRLEDALGRSGETTVEVDIPGSAAADTLYADFVETRAAVGQAVTLVAITGALPRKFYKASFALVIPADAEIVAGSFNAGAPGGSATTADGIWAGVGSVIEVEGPDGISSFDELDWWEQGDGARQLYFGLLPSVGAELSAASGELFSLQLKFSTPGVKRCHFIRKSGFENYLTFYSGYGREWGHWMDGTQILWDVYANYTPYAALTAGVEID